MATTSSNRLLINLGAQANDGTGDAIRAAFDKVNQNFETIFNVAGIGSGLLFTKLADAPKILSANKFLLTDATGLTVTQMTMVGANGIKITVDQTQKKVEVNATLTNLINDPNPILANNLSGANYRGISFSDPVDDQDIATKKWIFDHFVNRDAQYEYISSVNPITGANNTTTVVEGSTFRHNVQMVLTGTNTATNIGKVITTYDNTTTDVTKDLDLTTGPWRPSHLTRKDYVDTKISLQGIDTIDPETGQVNPAFGAMTGPLYLSRSPTENDPGNIAATKDYVDSTGFPSRQNFYVSLNGNDARYDIPPYKRGRSLAWSFRTINRAAQAALQYSKASQIKLGVYKRKITTNNYSDNVVIDSITAGAIPGTVRLNVSYIGGNGTDPFIERSIRPGQFLLGVNTTAIGEILNVSLEPSSNVQEYYEVKYVDYADTFETSITPDGTSGLVTFRLFEPNLIEIPDFWVGYKFVIDPVAGGGEGTIEKVGLYYAPNGNVYDEITVKMTTPLLNTNIISGDNWHVYSGYFETSEELWYGQRYNKLEISILVESGEYDEQLPIRIGDNISIKGDEFRRTIIKPAYVRGTTRYAISTSKWADVWFRRDTQVDGIIVVSLDETTDYATNTTATPDGVTNDSVTGVITFSLGSGNAPTSWVKKVFVGADGRGEITSVQGNTFSVNIAENNLGIRRIANTNVISPGSWHIYDPINFGYHYLRDPSRPVNYIANFNAGGFKFAAQILRDNVDFIKSEVVGYVDDVYGGTLVYDQATCARDVGLIVDALAYDLEFGGINSSINAADYYYSARVNEVINNELNQTIDAIGRISILAASLFTQTEIPAGNLYGTVDQVIGTNVAEFGAQFAIDDLVSAMQAILGDDPAFNPPKYTDQIDIFLMNDATMLRYLGANGHGGFMKVLDPEGQIKSKSPYTQTCSSFAQSLGRHRFAGGFFVDGFCGNLPLTTTASTASADTNGNLIYIPVSNVRRLPVFPTFFIHEGIKYEADYMLSYNSTNKTGTLVLNPNNPGGIESVSINSGNTSSEFAPNVTNLPLTFSSPGTAGAITARGYATTNAQGNISSIVVTYPGKGYETQPKISLGGATFNFTIVGGTITQITVNSGGKGYTTGTQINIAAPGGTGLTATASVASVDGNGAITAVTLVSGGTGYVSTPTVTFGRQIFSATIKRGFIGTLPSTVELITAGNRSMLANDFTQLNDLGYGIFATNGGFIENVSMFTYYCYTSYYALNGAILRTITGSSAYGTYGLVAEGSNPLEVPRPVVMPDDLTQIATVYSVAPYTNQKAGGDLYVTLSSIAGYAPFGSGEVEINHNGVRKTYSLRSSTQISGSLYSLSLDTTGGGLYAAVANGEPVTIRAKFIWRLSGLNATTLTRPSTVLTLTEQQTYNYRILEYTNLGSDYVLAEADSPYDYIQITPYSQGGVYRQGVGRPQITIAGTNYTSTTTQYAVTFPTPPTKTAVINGAQGTVDAPVSTVIIASASGQIHPGMKITGGGALANQYVTWVSLDRTVMQTSLTQVWSTASATLTFVGTTATGYALADGQQITSLKITDPGVGYDTAPTPTIASAGGTQAQATVSLSGISGTNVIKTLALSNVDVARINTGLTSSTAYYYVFGFEGETYKITDYKTPAQTNQEWGEITVQGYNTGTSVLTREMMIDPLYAGVSKNTNGAITVEISTLRATAHDMIDIGTGGYATSKIPNDLYGPPTIAPQPANETREIGKGRVYYVTTDQNGNFRVGKYFAVDQGRGTVTISAPISLTGISKLSFKKGVEVDEFSKDDTMAAGSISKVPVESAIVSYINHRLGVDKNGAVDAGLIGPGVMALNGALPMTGSLNMGANKLINLQVPTSSSDGATKGYVDGKISIDGMNEVSNDGGQDAGIMLGPLRLSGDPGTTVATTTATVNVAATVIYVDSTSALYKGMQVNDSAFPGGTIITQINNLGAVTVSNPATGGIGNGQTITFDGVRQAATKRYVDRSAQINQLRDVVLTNTADVDLLMFAGTLSANSATTTPLYNAARSVINVANSTSSITNTASSSGGGSDVTIARNGNYVVVKLVGGLGASNPITNHHINNAAAIAQSKLAMNAATVSASSVGITQASLGLSVFDSGIFSATNGWISLADSTSTSNGIAPSKMQQVPALGGLLGATAAGGSASYLSSSTVRSWLQVLSSAGGTFSGTINTNDILPNSNNTYKIGGPGQVYSSVSATNFYGSGANITSIPNAGLVNSSITVTAGTALSGGGTVALGGTITLNNTGVTSLTGTANQISVSAATGGVTLSLPQSIGTGNDVTFNRATLEYLTANAGATVEGSWTLGAGASFQATYADLAERYSSDAEYEPGTVLIFGGEREVTISKISDDRRVAGVVSTNPAYNMNVECPNGVSVALQGRVPCKVMGYIRKGDLMTTSHIPGVARANNDAKVGTIIGKALEDYQSTEVGVIEVAVGRL